MSGEADKCAKSASRNQRPPWAQQQRRRKEPTLGDPRGALDPGETPSAQEEVKTAGLPGKRPGKASESRRSPGPQRKLSDASNASEDLSKDSGCLSGKLSSSDSSSEISDCPSEGNKPDSPGGELSWTEGRAYESPGAERGGQGEVCAEAGTGAAPPAGGALAAPSSSGALLDLMMGDATEDLVREMEDLRSENEYLKDEVEELRCEMLEMRDMFQEEEVYQLQELRLQLEQANKTCRILQYRLRKAERRSIRVAQTGQVDGELVRTLEHDIKVAKSVSLRLYNELEAVQKKNSQLEWDNEVLREKTQELEVAKQVLQAEAEKARESSLKKKNIRSTTSKAEKRLSQQIEDDSGDLRCQLHFAKEELALMCKKLSKLVLESEGMQEQLAKYHSAYGDIDAIQSAEGKQNSTHTREAEVKVHLKLVEEEAMLLSRRIVELEVENRGLRAEMSDLRERGGGGGAEDEAQESRDAREENVPPDVKTTGGKERLKAREQNETAPLCSQTSCHIAREGPVGGERESADSRESDSKRNPESGLRGMTLGDFRTLLALRDHSCMLSSAIQLLKAQPTNGHHSSPSTFIPPTEPKSKTQTGSIPGPLNEALELLQAMLVAFIGRVEKLLTGKPSLHGEGHVCDPPAFPSLPGAARARHDTKESEYKQECVEDLRTTEVKQRARQSTAQRTGLPWDLVRSHRDPKMHLCLQILWILHRWCRVKGAAQEGKEARDKSVLELQSLLQQVGTELQDEPTESEAGAAQDKAAEPDVSGILPERRPGADRTRGSTGKRRRQFPGCGFKRKSWCYLSQEAARLDQEDPLKTWDHLIMPHSFPGLDLERISMNRSHTAPERSALRIYYSPPSARRVQLVQPVQSPNSDRESEDTLSPWCTPPTSLSPLYQGSTANLSDDMKEATGGWRATGSQGSGARFPGRSVDVATSGTQTHIKPQMVSVGLQTDGTQGSVRTSPSRLLNPSLASSRTHPISTSLDRLTSRTERSRANTSSPKLYRSRSATSASSVPSTSSTSTPRDRSPWNLSQQNQAGLSWTRHPNYRAAAAAAQSPGSPNSEPACRSSKPPNKSPGGLVTEFLRRVSGRAEKPAPGQKTRGGPKSLERVPSRPPAAPLQRSDSVTRIVNQRFMKQREESARGPREEKGGSLGSRHSGVTSEEGNYDCSSSGTLTFCFARPSRSTSDARLQRARLQSPAVGEGGAAGAAAGREFRM